MLGVHIRFNEESEIENKSKVRKILEDGGKFFNKYMSLYAKAPIMKTFLLPKLLHILRHMKLDMQIIQDFKVFSKQALWGSKKSFIALEFLERSITEGGIGWPNLMFEIMACKTLDLVDFLASTDVASKNLLLELWNRNAKYKNELRNDFRQVNIKIMDITEQKIEASLDLNPSQKQRDIYCLLQEKHRWKYRLENRIKLCSQRFGISKTLIESINKWLWKRKDLTAVEKNCF